MKITVIPIKVEAYDEYDEHLFTVELVDSECYSIVVPTVFMIEEWKSISLAINESLELMNPKEM